MLEDGVHIIVTQLYPIQVKDEDLSETRLGVDSIKSLAVIVDPEEVIVGLGIVSIEQDVVLIVYDEEEDHVIVGLGITSIEQDVILIKYDGEEDPVVVGLGITSIEQDVVLVAYEEEEELVQVVLGILSIVKS